MSLLFIVHWVNLGTSLYVWHWYPQKAWDLPGWADSLPATQVSQLGQASIVVIILLEMGGLTWRQQFYAILSSRHRVEAVLLAPPWNRPEHPGIPRNQEYPVDSSASCALCDLTWSYHVLTVNLTLNYIKLSCFWNFWISRDLVKHQSQSATRYTLISVSSALGRGTSPGLAGLAVLM